MRLVWLVLGDAVAAIVAAYIVTEYVCMVILSGSNPQPPQQGLASLIATVAACAIVAALGWCRVWARGGSR